jgi:hypothetical protein
MSVMALIVKDQEVSAELGVITELSLTGFDWQKIKTP